MIVDFAPFRIDLVEERLWKGPTLLTVQRKPFAVLRYLVTNPHRLVTRQELTLAVWGDVSVSESALRTHLCELRRLLKDQVIETVVGRGYRFIAQFTAEFGDVAAVNESLSRPAPLNAPPRLVGREEHLSALQASLQRVRAAERQIVLALGEPGLRAVAQEKQYQRLPLARDDAERGVGPAGIAYGPQVSSSQLPSKSKERCTS